MRILKGWIIVLVIILFGSPSSFVLATSTDSAIDITITMPSSAGGSGPLIPPTDNPPTVGAVTVAVLTSSAQFSWSASDDNGIGSVSFDYGITPSYGSNSTVVGSYQTGLVGLTPATTYYYRIIVTDTKPQSTNHTGTFTTDALPVDTTAPVISDIQEIPAQMSCSITWTVDEISLGEVTYGLTATYGALQSSLEGLALSHTANLTNLLSNTAYHYKVVATDQVGNSSASVDKLCAIPKETNPPSNPSNVELATTTSAIVLSWVNPGDSDFSGLKILRKTSGAPTGPSDGTLVYNGSSQTFTDATVASDITYYYTLFAYDTSENYSSGTSVNGRVITTVINEICNNTIDDDADGKIDCLDSACITQAMCQSPEICNNSLDDDRDGLTDCADSQCSGANYCAPKNEVCDNTIDDDGNGAIDCADVSCFAFAACSSVPEIEFERPQVTVPSFTHLTIDRFIFQGGNRSFTFEPSAGSVIGLSGWSASVSIAKQNLPSVPEKLVLKINGSGDYQFSMSGESYYADFIFPRIGGQSAFIEVHYGYSQLDVVDFNIISLGYGTVSADNAPLTQATVTLLNQQGQPISGLVVSNQQTTNENGTYGWFIPNGIYSVKITKDGYYDRTTPSITVRNNVINEDIKLVTRPPDLFEDVSASSTLSENVNMVVQNVAKKTKALVGQSAAKIKDTIIAVEEFKKDPEVQKTASHVVAPAAVGVAVATTAGIAWANMIPFLRLLFLQPLMLLGARRRQGWGQVYNSLNKLPVDLATLRLVNAETGKVIQSKVTDKQGRYAFVVNPGKYLIQVMKDGYTFPSSLLKTVTTDGRRTDIYHGEIIDVTENEAVVTANIPLDQAGEFKRPARIFWQRVGRTAQLGLSWAGLLVTVASLYISPVWYVWMLLGVHILFFIIFYRLALPAKIKSWGIVYDAVSKRPVGRAIARLFNSEYDKMVATQITDGSGRYYFLAGDDTYYVTYDHSDYQSEKTNELNLKGKDAETITVDVGLTKGKNVLTPPAPASLDKQAQST